MSNEIILIVDTAEDYAMILPPRHSEWKIYDPLTQNKDTDVHEVDADAWAWRGPEQDLELGKLSLMATICQHLVECQNRDPDYYTMDELHHLRRTAYKQLWENDIQ